MDNTHKYTQIRGKSRENDVMLYIPSCLHGFRNVATTRREAKSIRTVYLISRKNYTQQNIRVTEAHKS